MSFLPRTRSWHTRYQVGVTIAEAPPHNCPMILPTVFEAIARYTIPGQTQLEAEALKALPSKQALILQTIVDYGRLRLTFVCTSRLGTTGTT
jgi:hypothetical protein